MDSSMGDNVTPTSVFSSALDLTHDANQHLRWIDATTAVHDPSSTSLIGLIGSQMHEALSDDDGANTYVPGGASPAAFALPRRKMTSLPTFPTTPALVVSLDDASLNALSRGEESSTIDAERQHASPPPPPRPLASIDDSLTALGDSNGVRILRAALMAIPTEEEMAQRGVGRQVAYVFVGQLPTQVKPALLASYIGAITGCPHSIVSCQVRAAATGKHASHGILGVLAEDLPSVLSWTRRIYLTHAAAYYMPPAGDTAGFQRLIARTVTQHQAQVTMAGLSKACVALEESKKTTPSVPPAAPTSGPFYRQPYDGQSAGFVPMPWVPPVSPPAMHGAFVHAPPPPQQPQPQPQAQHVHAYHQYPAAPLHPMARTHPHQGANLVMMPSGSAPQPMPMVAQQHQQQYQQHFVQFVMPQQPLYHVAGAYPPHAQAMMVMAPQQQQQYQQPYYTSFPPPPSPHQTQQQQQQQQPGAVYYAPAFSTPAAASGPSYMPGPVPSTASPYGPM